jgi:DNA-binding response OmpR family regulator
MPPSKRRILFVEDDADTRELVSFVLRQANYEVVIAENNDKALPLARTMHFDLYMIDNWMPGGSGIDLCERLREFDSSTPILFYSGAAYDQDKRAAFAAGAQGYLTKPVENDRLISEISKLISEVRRKNADASLDDQTPRLRLVLAAKGAGNHSLD